MEQERKPRPFIVRVLADLVRRYFQDNVGRSAAELSYYLLFSLFPLLIFLNVAVSMLHLSTDMLSTTLGVVLPAQVADILTSYLSYIQGLDAPVLLYACLFLTVYALSRAITSLIQSVSRAYRITRQGRFNALASIILSVLLLFSVIVLLLLMMVSENLLRQVSEYIAIDIPELLLKLWDLLRMMVGPVYMFLILSCFYAVVGFGKYRFTQAMPGAGFAVVTWFVVTSAFSYYISHASRYSLIYGSLAAFMVLMLWFYLTGMVIILGGELNHVLEKNSEHHLVDKGE